LLKAIHTGLNAKVNAYARIYDFAKENNYKVIEKYKINSEKFMKE
jgi:hypothetical protein